MMDKKDYAIIGLLLVIIALLSYNVINVYEDSKPEVFEFSDYIITAPAGSHYHNVSGVQSFYLSEKDVNPVFGVGLGEDNNISVEDFDIMYNSLKNGEISKSDFINVVNVGEEDMAVIDINIGDFNGEPEISMLMQNPKNQSQKLLTHIIKHNNDKIFLVGGELDNATSTQMYHTFKLK